MIHCDTKNITVGFYERKHIGPVGKESLMRASYIIKKKKEDVRNQTTDCECQGYKSVIKSCTIKLEWETEWKGRTSGASQKTGNNSDQDGKSNQCERKQGGGCLQQVEDDLPS